MNMGIPKLVGGIGMAGFNEKEHQNVIWHMSVTGVALYNSITLSQWFRI